MLAPTLLGQSYRNAVLNSVGLAGYWRLGEASGTVAKDECGRTEGTYVNSPTLGSSGALSGDPNTAGTFASSPTVTLPISGTISGSFSLAIWANPSSTAANNGMFGSRDTGLDTVDCKLSGGTSINIDIGPGSGWFSNASTSYTYTTGVWYFIVLTVYPTGFTLYANGASIGSGTWASQTPLLTNGSKPVQIGAVGFNPPQERFNGKLDEFAVWSRVLAGAEIARLYSIGRGF